MKILIGQNPMGLEKAIPALQAQYPEHTFALCPDRGPQLLQDIADADIYVGWLSREIFNAGKKLQWVQSPSSGVNMFLDIPELRDGPVLLTSASGTHAGGVADSTLAMILAVTRGIVPSVRDQMSKTWNPAEIRKGLVELTDSTMGIIGLGAIGRATAKRAKGFDMRVIAVDLNPNQQSPYVDEVWGLDQLNRLLAEADYVVVLVPYTAQTDNMIGAEQIAQMKPGALLVGMSRGGIIDQEAMIEALKAGKIAGAVLDVFKPEPLPADHALWDLPNVLIAPHIAGGTQFEGKHVLDIFTENLARFFAGQRPLRNQVDKQAGF
jgi:phosphoglycerate dehydrogenase-like enzyme